MRGFDGPLASSSQYRRHPTIDINHLTADETRRARSQPNRSTNHVNNISPVCSRLPPTGMSGTGDKLAIALPSAPRSPEENTW